MREVMESDIRDLITVIWERVAKLQRVNFSVVL